MFTTVDPALQTENNIADSGGAVLAWIPVQVSSHVIRRAATWACSWVVVEELVNAPRIQSSTYTITPGYELTNGTTPTFANISTLKQTYNQSSGAFGAKYSLFGRLILSGNLLVALNDGGLRQRVAPLIGLSYTF